MRDILNAILAFIGAESLTDEEFGSLDIDDVEDPAQVYPELLAVLEAREGVSDIAKRLKFYFLAKGHSGFSGNKPVPAPRSNIFVGSKL